MASKHPVRGGLAGIAGGLVASWAMNVWTAGPGSAISKGLEAPEDQNKIASGSDGEDATMKAADAIASTVSGGQHLSHEERATNGPLVHYAFGVIMGGLYGGLAEYIPLVRSGFGTSYAGALFVAGDLVAVPSLGLSKPLSAYPASSFANPLSAHLVYGVTMELVRRTVRLVL